MVLLDAGFMFCTHSAFKVVEAIAIYMLLRQNCSLTFESPAGIVNIVKESLTLRQGTFS